MLPSLHSSISVQTCEPRGRNRHPGPFPACSSAHSCPRKAALLWQAQHPPPIPELSSLEHPWGSGRVPRHHTHLLAGPHVVHPHAGDSVAPIATGTGLTAEAGGCVDALGAREAGVGMSTLRHEERDRLQPQAWHPAPWGDHCPVASWQGPSLASGCIRRGEVSSAHTALAALGLLTHPRTVPTSSMSAQYVPLPSSPGGQGPQRYPGYSYVSMQSTPLKQGLGLQRDRCSWKPEEGQAGGETEQPFGPLRWEQSLASTHRRPGTP